MNQIQLEITSLESQIASQKTALAAAMSAVPVSSGAVASIQASITML